MSLPPLIPRSVLFGNPKNAAPDLAPDGSKIIYRAPVNGVMNIRIRNIDGSDDRPLTHDTGRGIQTAFWAPNSRDILYLQDRDGDENWRIYATTGAGGEPRVLTPQAGVQARFIGFDHDHPDEALVALNDRIPQLHDVHHLHLPTGKLTLAAQNDINAQGWVADHNLVVRIAVVPQPDGGGAMLHRPDAASPWTEIMRWGNEDDFLVSPMHFENDNRTLRLISSIGTNSGELRLLDTVTGKQTVVASDPIYDVSGILQHPRTRKLQAVAFERERTDWKVLDPAIDRHMKALAALQPGDFGPSRRTLDDRLWLVNFDSDDRSVAYWLYNTETGEGTFLFATRPELEGLSLANLQPVSFQSRDGLTIHGYLTLPRGVDPLGLPTIIDVHGGPWHRDSWGYNPESQWLANRGYAVMQVNFRGSTGYGKDFVNAANKEWGGKMQDDISDAVKWLVRRGIADPRRVGIYGGSYGGFAVLSGMTKTPELYACGVDIVGPSNLFSWQESIPPYWEMFLPVLHHRVGHPVTDAEMFRERSPLFHLDRIAAPLLIAQGANDPRVPLAESRQIVAALKEKGLSVEYLEFADEGHGFIRPENKLKFYGAAEKFLAEHLGGRYEE